MPGASVAQGFGPGGAHRLPEWATTSVSGAHQQIKMVVAPQRPRLNLSGCKPLRSGDRMAGAGRIRNGRFGVRNSNKQTFVKRIAKGSRRPIAVVRGREVNSAKLPERGVRHRVRLELHRLQPKASPKRMRERLPLILRFGVSRRSDSGRWIDVLVHAEQICRIILPLHGDQPIEVRAIARLDAGLPLIVRHEVHIAAAEIVGCTPSQYALAQLFNAGALAGSGSMAAITMDQVASRAPHGVSPDPTACTALSMG